MEVQENNTVKQVIVMRKDLRMSRGKMIAQGSHASISFLTKDLGLNDGKIFKTLTEEQQEWINGIFTKICLRVSSEEDLICIYNRAKDKNLTVHMITDVGKTEFDGVPTKTCLAIGPHRSSKIDPITKELKLL